MRIDKAIKVLADYKTESAFNATPEFEAALELGIAALEAIKATREDSRLGSIVLLAGETTD